MSKNLTSRAEDYSKWYNELVVKAGLAESSGVRGCMVIKPYGYAIWERMRDILDKMFKDIPQIPIFLFLFPKVILKRKRKMQKALPKSVPWLPTTALKLTLTKRANSW